MELAGKHIVLGVTGGIAAYKAAELVRLLVREGAAVQVVMTEAATRFVTPVTFQALSGRPVFTDQWDPRVANNMAHIDLSRQADALLVAPASADFLAKLANGLADDLLTTLVLARDCRLLVAPAMNRQMWENPATCRNLATLRSDGVNILGPACGDQACGETGLGRMLEAEEILLEMVAHFQPRLLAGKRVLLTAGPTFEAIDPVRGITNLSTGKMGYAIARAAREAGAQVTLVSGPVSLPCPRGSTASMSAAHCRCTRRCTAGWLKTTCSSPSPPSPITGRPRPSHRRSRKALRRRHRRSNWCRIRTSWRKSPRCQRRRCASALPPKARSCMNTPRTSGAAKDPTDRRQSDQRWLWR
jgi:phosphopantothenoylcysteine decarboxylase/phosphopantothenate--cysteine ligase